jgi:hypothetical protein
VFKKLRRTLPSSSLSPPRGPIGAPPFQRRFVFQASQPTSDIISDGALRQFPPPKSSAIANLPFEAVFRGLTFALLFGNLPTVLCAQITPGKKREGWTHRAYSPISLVLRRWGFCCAMSQVLGVFQAFRARSANSVRR